MRFLKRIAGILGLLKDENHDPSDEDNNNNNNNDSSGDHADKEQTRRRRPTKGFSVQVPVSVDRAVASQGPLLVQCSLGDGGVQGLRWYAKRLRIDEDGDVADEFLEEVLPEASGPDGQGAFPKFAVKYNTRPAKVRNQIIAADGNIRHCVEYKGRLQWV
ncbi:uncharacterized protein LOC131248172 [Magnolia sinica]|uniref:uncharacterized protein LOC131248172 n=1 Tax=Magnolia sinica TaxID=86752 RepID=UPI00265ACCA6|nr:uncharacterized protein LOC131248172 [Magnolia sinica]